MIADALTGESFEHDKDALEMISQKAKVKIPEQIAALFDKEVAQKTVIDKEQIEQEILSFLG